MPREPAMSDIHLNSIVVCLNTVLPLLNNLHDGFGTPFMQAISNTTVNLLSAVQKVKNNKDECVHLMKDIHEIIFAIAKLHMQSELQGSLPPATLDQIGQFTKRPAREEPVKTLSSSKQDENAPQGLSGRTSTGFGVIQGMIYMTTSK
ncbi:hypothetical protein FB451DRAFT_1164955 [Mycena latifolia]|nr:hypothetical protein FB451DRAFT_1164955 [Mycena latifolia]